MDATPGTPDPRPSEPPPKRRNRRFGNLRGVRRALQDTYNAVEQDAIPLTKGKVLGYLASLLNTAMAGSELEARIERLERLAASDRDRFAA